MCSLRNSSWHCMRDTTLIVVLLYHDLWHQDEETIKRDQIEGDQTGSLTKTSHRGIAVHELCHRCDRMRQRNVSEKKPDDRKLVATCCWHRMGLQQRQ